MINPSITANSVKESRMPLYFSLAVLAILIILYVFFPGAPVFLKEALLVLTSDDEHRIKIWVDGFSWFGPVLLVLAMVVQMFLIIIPSLVLMVVCILAYGPVLGSLIAFISIYSASSVGYLIGRYLGPVFVDKIIGQKSKAKGVEFLNRYGFWAVFITRINPFLSNDAVSLVSGVLKMPYWKFIFASLSGIAPLILFIAILGKSTEELTTGLLWSSAFSFLIFSLYVYLNKKHKQNL